MNLVLHGIRNAHVKRANALSELGGMTEDDLTRKYSVILSNPPFAGVLPKESIRTDLPTNSKKSELLFLGVIMEALAPGGRCAVVVPEGLLFGASKAHVDLRKKLVEDFELLTVVSLPAGVFKPYAGVKTGVLVFRKPPQDRRKQKLDKVWFYEVRNDGYDPEKIAGGVRPLTPGQNDIPDLLAHWEQYKRSGFRKPPGVEAGTLLSGLESEPRSWWASEELIATRDYMLAASRYKPQVQQEALATDPTGMVRELIQAESEIAAGLEALLAELESVE